MTVSLQERKEVKRALAPEFRAKLPRNKTLGKGDFGIRYSYRRCDATHIFTRWYVKESGRDQAFKRMRTQRIAIYALLQKCFRCDGRVYACLAEGNVEIKCR